MSVTIQHINNDSTFLLHFHPKASSPPSDLSKTFTVLIDPWLTGPSTLVHPAIQLTTRPTASIVTSLADLNHIDIVLITQDKTDHCHRDTLCTLPKDTSAIILATPAAAKTIRKWRHFPPSQVVAMSDYHFKNRSTLFKMPVATPGSTGFPGEITIVNITSKLDLAGVHNAVGITYRPPYPGLTNGSPIENGAGISSAAQEVSMLYTPHGINTSMLVDYLDYELHANPLTILLHGFTIEENPRWLGGSVNNGAIGGTQVAKVTKAKYWVSAHDEAKDNSGIVVLWLKTRRFELREVKTMLHEASSDTEVCTIDYGESRTFSP